jgi:5,10-methylene-tetrahydrofolate dehydrogenase/methenyl tetrahydrofolate cyclohydrolase
MKRSVGHVPGLAVVLVGDRRDSESYVRYKVKGCEEVGIKSLLAKLPGNCSEDEVMDSVSRFNEDPSVHGILVQLPLPEVMCFTVLVFPPSKHKICGIVSHSID